MLPDERAPDSLRPAATAIYVHLMGRPNADAAGRPDLATPSSNDGPLIEHIAAALDHYSSQPDFWSRLEAAEPSYAHVLNSAREQGIPDVVAALPVRQSGYQTGTMSPVCAAGPWQLMPETATRLGIRIRGCTLRGRPGLWAPQLSTPPAPLMEEAAYVESRAGRPQCRIESCELDERQDLEASTEGALKLLEEAWNQPVIRGSDAPVQLLLLAFELGFDDSRFGGGERPSNLLPTLNRYQLESSTASARAFYAQSLACSHTTQEGAEAPCRLHEDAQAVPYTAAAHHALATCYYAAHHSTRPIWKPTDSMGYCDQLPIPQPSAGSRARQPTD